MAVLLRTESQKTLNANLMQGFYVDLDPESKCLTIYNRETNTRLVTLSGIRFSNLKPTKAEMISAQLHLRAWCIEHSNAIKCWLTECTNLDKISRPEVPANMVVCTQDKRIKIIQPTDWQRIRYRTVLSGIQVLHNNDTYNLDCRGMPTSIEIAKRAEFTFNESFKLPVILQKKANRYLTERLAYDLQAEIVDNALAALT